MNRLRRGDWLLILIFVVSSLVCTRLGIWQLSRLEQRLRSNAALEAQLLEQPIPFSTDLPNFTRVVLEGTFRADDEVVLKNRSLDEVSGFHLITPLKTMDGLLILIDRGWIPYEEGSTLSLAASRTDEPVIIEGVLLPGQDQPRLGFLADPLPKPGEAPLRSWRFIDIAGIQAQLGTPLHNQYIGLTHIQAATEPQPSPDFQADLSNGPHLGYAIQWFSFAAIAIVGGYLMLRRRVSDR